MVSFCPGWAGWNAIHAFEVTFFTPSQSHQISLSQHACLWTLEKKWKPTWSQICVTLTWFYHTLVKKSDLYWYIDNDHISVRFVFFKDYLCSWNLHDIHQYASWMVLGGFQLDLDAAVWWHPSGHLLRNAAFFLDRLLWRTSHGKSHFPVCPNNGILRECLETIWCRPRLN